MKYIKFIPSLVFSFIVYYFGFKIWDTIKSSNRAEKFWDMLSSKTDKRARKFEQTYSKSIERTKKYLKSDDIVLDFACGTGLVCNKIVSNVAMIHAVDISSKMKS